MTTLKEAAKAARQHDKAIEKATQRLHDAQDELVAAQESLDTLTAATEGVKYTLWDAALKTQEEPAPE